MSSVTTQLQKAIKIAVKDGFKQIGNTSWYISNRNSKQEEHSNNFLLDRYLTDLNYLMPIAVKVRDEIAEKSQGYAVYSRLYDAYCDLKLDENNQYTELFNALYQAVKMLENE